MLAFVYFGFVYLGSHYTSQLTSVEPELMLPSIALYLIGDYATIIIGIAILLSCLTTAVALNNIYARFITTTLKLNSGFFPLVLFMTTLVSFIISLLDFRGIAAFLAPALEISYPGLIALTILSIVLRNHRNAKMLAFWSITAIMIVLR